MKDDIKRRVADANRGFHNVRPAYDEPSMRATPTDATFTALVIDITACVREADDLS